MGQLSIFVGHYGSGKTEVAVNYAIARRADVIADLDTVNPYFRTNDARKVLEERGIQVIAPHYAGTNVDIPALPAEVASAFIGKNAVLDVGGDDDGAAVLGRFHEQIRSVTTEVYCVINAFRPDTATAEDCISMIRAIECASRLRVTALINNANLMEETTYRHIETGEALVRAVANETGIRFFGNTVMRDLAKPKDFVLDKYIKMV